MIKSITLLLSFTQALVMILLIHKQRSDMEEQPLTSEVIHKEKEPKRKLKTKGLLPIVPIGNRTIGKNTPLPKETQTSNEQQTIAATSPKEQDKIRTRNQIINMQIDEWLINGAIEGLIQDDYIAYYAKACHTLGLQMMNALRVNAMNGRDPQKLFAYKVKGAMQLHFKKQFYADNPTAINGDYDG